jgi:hypothetical protein
METINVKDLPEPIAQAIAIMVNTLREQLHIDKKKQPVHLPVWEGKPTGTLTREEIYDDVA